MKIPAGPGHRADTTRSAKPFFRRTGEASTTEESRIDRRPFFSRLVTQPDSLSSQPVVRTRNSYPGNMINRDEAKEETASAETKEREEILKSFLRGPELPAKINSRIKSATKAFSISQLKRMKRFGLQFRAKGDLIKLAGEENPLMISRGGKANYQPEIWVIAVDKKSSTNDIRHELAHAWDHVQAEKPGRKKLEDFTMEDVLKRIKKKEAGKLRFKSGTRSGSKIKTAFVKYSKRMKGGRPAASGEVKRECTFENAGTREGYSLKDEREFYAEGYSVFHGFNQTAQAKLLFYAPELYSYLEKEAHQHKLSVPDKSALKKETPGCFIKPV